MSQSSTFKLVALLAVAGVIGGISAIAHHGTKADVTATITGKERVTTGSGDNQSSKYLIFTDRETFENTDTLWGGKFNSSDLYGRLRDGQTCLLHVVGVRIPAFSTYRNIISAECEA